VDQPENTNAGGGEQRAPDPKKADRGGPAFFKEHASKEDGRYIIFYAFEDGEAGEEDEG
jgi:hypothetical protein